MKIAYADISPEEVDQQLAVLWGHFPGTRSYVENTWLPMKESWFAAYTNRYINLGMQATQRAEGFHSKLKRIQHRIMPVDRLFDLLKKQMKEDSACQELEAFRHMNTHWAGSDKTFDQLRSVCSRYALNKLILPQADRLRTESYIIHVVDEHTYMVVAIKDNAKKREVCISPPSSCLGLRTKRIEANLLLLRFASRNLCFASTRSESFETCFDSLRFDTRSFAKLREATCHT